MDMRMSSPHVLLGPLSELLQECCPACGPKIQAPGNYWEVMISLARFSNCWCVHIWQYLLGVQQQKSVKMILLCSEQPRKSS